MEAADIIGILGGVVALLTAIGVIINNHQKNKLEESKYARQADLDEQTEKFKVLKATVDELRLDNQRYREDREEYMQQLSQLKEERKELLEKLEKKEREYQELDKKLTLKIQQKDVEIAELNKKIADLTTEIEKIRRENNKNNCE